jgi:uncharacterized damage-inducible protein DinB
MRHDDIRFLFDYDRWATRRVLLAAAAVDTATWSAERVVDERGLGGILLHQLGAHQRWRHGLSGATGERPRPERGPLPAVSELRAAWDQEWLAFDAWFDALTEDDLEASVDGLVTWQCLVHLANHGTQHRSEAAVLLTEAGCSPGDLDMLDFIVACAAPPG